MVDLRDVEKRRRKHKDGWKTAAKRIAIEDPFDPDPWADPCRSNNQPMMELILARFEEAAAIIADSKEQARDGGTPAGSWVAAVFEMGPNEPG